MAIRNAKGRTPSPLCVVNHDGSITFRGKRLTVPDIHLETLVGSGANGFVVKGRHRLLSLPLAVKFWASLRTRDSRNKMAQGIAEVKKLFEAERYRSVVLARTAGESDGVFYAVMDLFNGQTLQDWLKQTRPLGLRRLVAYRLVDEVCAMSHGRLYHGDLHTRNVLVDSRRASLLDRREPRIGIIDFGTSLFASRPASRARHWRVFGETLDRLMWPFELGRMASSSFPASGTASSVRAWYRASLVSLRHVLIRLGADDLIDGDELHEFYKEEPELSHEVWVRKFYPVSDPVLELTKTLIGEGGLDLSEACLGPGHLWFPPVRSAAYDAVGTPWNTSITDEAWW